MFYPQSYVDDVRKPVAHVQGRSNPKPWNLEVRRAAVRFQKPEILKGTKKVHKATNRVQKTNIGSKMQNSVPQ